MSEVSKKRSRSLRGATVAGGFAMLIVGGQQAAEAATGTVGAHEAKTVSCNTTMNMAAPKMLAVNSTPGVDSQKVVFQALVFKWDGSAWVLVKSGQVLEGNASDTASPTTWFDYRLGYVVGSGNQSFTVTGGYFKVAIRYWWLGKDGSTTGYDYLWAPTYITQIGAVASSCRY